MRAIWILVTLAWVLVYDFSQDYQRAPTGFSGEDAQSKEGFSLKKPKGRRRPRDAL
jgi:hypothetical protein